MHRNKKHITRLTAALLAVTACAASAVPASAYVRFEGTPPDTAGKTLYLNLRNTDDSIVFEHQVVADGIFDSMEDFYGMTMKDGTVITEENLQQVWTDAHSKNPRYQWGDWTYGDYDLTCVYDDGSQDAAWEHGVYRIMPDFPVEKELTDTGIIRNYGTDTEEKVSDRGEYRFQRQADGTLKWTNGIYNHPELDVPYTVLATKMECVTYTRNDSEPLPIDSHVYKTIVEQDLYLSSFRGFSNNYSLIYEGDFAVPTLFRFADTGLPESCIGDVIHYRLVDFYDTFLFEDGYITFNEDGTVKDRFVERSGSIGPDGKASLMFTMDETPQMRDYFWPTEVEITAFDENGNEVHEDTVTVQQPSASGIILKSDVDMDGSVTVADAIALQKYLLGRESISFGSSLNADINSDGLVNIYDLTLLKKQLISSRTAAE